MVKVIRPADRDSGTAQTPGMRREAGISAGTAGSEGLWMGTAVNAPGASSGAHHHGANESGIYILRGRVRFRWGEQLEHVIDTEPGDFVFVPPYEVHMEENLDTAGEAELLLARNSQEQVVVNVPDPRASA
ncbi:MAG: cupin domain-containing protein [Dehalococcoidia bacterium]